jgi:hypothetical protein
VLTAARLVDRTRTLAKHQGITNPQKRETQMSYPKQELCVPKMALEAMMDLIAPPAVLSTESLKSFLALRDQFVSSLKPRDFVELRFVMEMVDAAWHIKRYTFHKALGIERCYRKSQEFQARRQKLLEAREASLAKETAETMTQTPSDIAAVTRLEEKLSDTIAEVDHAVTWTAEELGHNAALERSMLFQESLEKLNASATVRFYKAMDSLEHYRHVFRPRVREKAEKIVEATEYEDFQEFLDDPPSPAVAGRLDAGNASKKRNGPHAAR